MNINQLSQAPLLSRALSHVTLVSLNVVICSYRLFSVFQYLNNFPLVMLIAVYAEYSFWLTT